mmetsp:Transcript_16550/g.47647  ORF Transcript_16550/g.47647 Transcript_16550/m.47647 type:complete len:320 (-) Transcript_16550:254-1213(-)
MDPAATKSTAVLDKAPPPAHSVLVVATMIVAFLATLPSLESIDEHATVEAFTTTHFESMSTATLAFVRLSFALFGFATTVFQIMRDEIEIVPAYKRRSKLKKPDKWVVGGLRTHGFFTQWSWLLMWTSFALSGSIAYLSSSGREDWVRRNPWLLRAALLMFETAAPTEFMVAAVVKYAIWPQVLANGRPTDGLRKTRALIMHNACIFMILTEVALLGNIPIKLEHFSVAPLFGIVYVLFAWFMSDKWRPKEDGPQFLYFFLDTTLGSETSISLLALLLVLTSFFVMFWFVDDGVVHIPGVLERVVVICALSSLVCRFHD